jgi:hypothetical protein
MLNHGQIHLFCCYVLSLKQASPGYSVDMLLLLHVGRSASWPTHQCQIVNLKGSSYF